jgi:hypothetical protein
MASFLIQSTFQFGEVSPLLYARIDSPIYYRSARRLHNVVTIPQGGVEVRFGTKYVAPINGSITDYRLINPFIFDYEDGSQYLMIFREFAVDIYHNNINVATVPTSYTAAEIEDLSIAQSPTLIFIAHGNHAPAILTRTSAHAGWSLNVAPTFTNYPTYDFSQNYDAATFSVHIAGVPISTAQNIIGQTVDLVSSVGIFTNDHVGGLYFGAAGTIRITGFTSATQVTGRIIAIFDSSSSLFTAPHSIPGSMSVLTEIAFSATRGWPKIVSFFQNRIFFARTQSLPGGLFGSNYNGFTTTSFNFDDSEALATNAVSTVIYSRRSVMIEHMVAYKSLLIFTTSGLYSSPLLEDFPLTPTNVSYINLQTADSSSKVDPQILDNQVIFFDKGGRKVKDVNLMARTGTFATNNISVLCPHLIDQPNSAGVYENSTVKDGTWLLLTMNGEALDGTLAIYQSVPEQQITAWSESSTDGKFRYVVADEETVYFIVEREINGTTALYIEQLSWDVRTDCAITKENVLPFTTVTGLSHLEGKSVRIKGDDYVMESQIVTGGEITLEYPVNKVEVGLNYNPEVIPMPLNVPTQMGNDIYIPKTVKKIYVDYYLSKGITVNGQVIPTTRINSDSYNDVATPKSDFYAVCAFNGWNPRQQFSISQEDPLPFTLRGIGFEVEQ